MSRVFWQLLLLAIPLTANGQENDLCTFKRYTGKVGDQIKVTTTHKQVDKSVLDFLGKPIPKERITDRVHIHTTEILAVDNQGRPIKLKRYFDKAEETTFGATKKLPMDGKTVLIEREKDKFTFTIVGEGPVKGTQQSYFLGEFNRNPSINDFDLYFPEQPAKVGAAWDIKSAFLRSNEPFQFDEKKATGTAKLVKAFAKNGRKFGSIELRARAPISGVTGYPAGTLKAGCTMDLELKADGCIDGSSPERTTQSVQKTFINFGNAELEILATTKSTVELMSKK